MDRRDDGGGRRARAALGHHRGPLRLRVSAELRAVSGSRRTSEKTPSGCSDLGGAAQTRWTPPPRAVRTAIATSKPTSPWATAVSRRCLPASQAAAYED